MSGWGKSAKDLLGSLQKFDDLNVVDFNKRGSGDENKLIDLKEIDLTPIQKILDLVRKIKEEIQTPGITIAPLSIFINNKGFAKIKIGIARGKKNYDKRNDIKDRDNERELDRIIKNY